MPVVPDAPLPLPAFVAYWAAAPATIGDPDSDPSSACAPLYATPVATVAVTMTAATLSAAATSDPPTAAPPVPAAAPPAAPAPVAPAAPPVPFAPAPVDASPIVGSESRRMRSGALEQREPDRDGDDREALERPPLPLLRLGEARAVLAFGEVVVEPTPLLPPEPAVELLRQGELRALARDEVLELLGERPARAEEQRLERRRW